MTEGTALHLAREAIALTMLLSGPLLIASLIVGLLISIFQAATQIQEQTLTFVPKLVAIMFTLLVLGSWMLNTMISYTVELLSTLGQMAR
ncbi:MAG: flagellar biosynthesis protein FliQ [Firmicutes bacterium]|nr:flagellar biosynthesis protein FliQ [Dethiobacter sp.]MBS3888650.1 flagellar biosynthesis protein FliQ [Bacillota bacterium]MBS4055543.1 flagellar biosynthesis protein FliQ [Thermaerobacter sp.]